MRCFCYFFHPLLRHFPSFSIPSPPFVEFRPIPLPTYVAGIGPHVPPWVVCLSTSFFYFKRLTGLRVPLDICKSSLGDQGRARSIRVSAWLLFSLGSSMGNRKYGVESLTKLSGSPARRQGGLLFVKSERGLHSAGRVFYRVFSWPGC